MSILSRNQHVQKASQLVQQERLAANQASNPLHPNKSDDEYEELRRVYYPVKECIQKFFIDFCSEDYVTANEKVLKELIRTGVFAPNTTGTIFGSVLDFKLRQEYVFSLPYPTDYEQMQSFIEEVRRGQLEFLCRYPLNATDGITILDTIRQFL
ncbi:MAG: hypothetical protein ACI4BD_07780 [Paludibacteraceae bacterium]